MQARCLVDRRVLLSETAFAEIVLWQLPEPTRHRPHGYKYRLALVHQQTCVLRYDNETGKGDHIHRDGREWPYRFVGPDELIADFLAEAKEWMDAHPDP